MQQCKYKLQVSSIEKTMQQLVALWQAINAASALAK